MKAQSPSGGFVAETGVNVPCVSAEEMRELDRIATQETGPSLLQMMENAGRNLASLAIDLMASRWKAAHVLVLAGGGGNGGGGICSARHLSNHGVAVSLCIAAPGRLSDAAAAQQKIFASTFGNQITPSQAVNSKPDFIIDALIGYGLRRFSSITTTELIDWANGQNISILSLDIPSGLDATTGAVPDRAIRPAWTLTLALPKSGLHPQNSGQLILADLGIPVAAIRRVAPNYTSPYDQRFYVGLERQGIGQD